MMKDIVSEESLYREKCRLATFKNWPFKNNANCTPAKLAAAGFYFCPSDLDDDLVKCFICGKELNGWEPEDDPWKEHANHSEKCPFVLRGNVTSKLTVTEALELERDKIVFLLEQRNKVKSCELREVLEKVKNEVSNLKRTV